MTRGRTVTLEGWLAGLAALTGGSAIGVVFTPLPEIATVLLAMVSATAVGLRTIGRWLSTRFSLFDAGYQVGFADAAREYCPTYPVDNVRPLRLPARSRRDDH